VFLAGKEFAKLATGNKQRSDPESLQSPEQGHMAVIGSRGPMLAYHHMSQGKDAIARETKRLIPPSAEILTISWSPRPR